MSRKKWLALALAIMLVVGLMGGMAMADNGKGIFVEGIFGINRNTADVWTLNPDTGAVEKLFDTGLAGSNVGPNGLAYDAENGLFYYVTYTGAAQLYVYDGTSATFLYNLGDSIANACFYDGKYYYIAGGTDDLKEVVFDAEGAVETVNTYEDISGGVYSWTFNGDIAISEDGTIYIFGASRGYNFFKVQRDGTGFEEIKLGYDMTLQLAFDADGRLIAHDNSGGINYAIDTTDGELTELSTTADGKLFTDMAQGWVFEPPTYNICGRKFVKVDDGDNYPYRDGWEMSLEVLRGEEYVPYLVDGAQLTATTNAHGWYCFTDLPPGTYRVYEEEKPGWEQIGPTLGYHEVVLPDGATDPCSERPAYDFCNKFVGCWGDDTFWAFGNIENNSVDGNPSNAWGWTNGPLTDGRYERTLWAGAGQNDTDKGYPVGTATIIVDEGCVTVQIAITAEDVYLKEIHVWIGDTPLPLIPRGRDQTPTPTAAPGQFGIEDAFDLEDGETYWEIRECGFDDPIYVSIHGVAWVQVACE